MATELPNIDPKMGSGSGLPVGPDMSLPMGPEGAALEGAPPESAPEAPKPGDVDPTDSSDIDAAIEDFNSRTVIGQKRLDQFREVIIKAMFKLMKDAGIDPNDVESIQQFLTGLEQMDPDIAELFDLAFNDLLGDEQPGETEEPSLMDKYSNLSGPTLGQGEGIAPAGVPPADLEAGMEGTAAGPNPFSGGGASSMMGPGDDTRDPAGTPPPVPPIQ